LPLVRGEYSIALTEISVLGWHCATLGQTLAPSEEAAHAISVANALMLIPWREMRDIDGAVAWSERQAQHSRPAAKGGAMLKVTENERLTRVGPGTPMGELMRRYWHPIAAVAELDDNPVKHVKLLGESLVLYRDRQGRLGLIGDTCPHRRASMLYGVPEDEGLRCPYHGWLFSETGQCLEMPAEQNRFHRRNH
jgi:nitrite reductase/ring-hydroxylating ferredoxin subunit